METVRDAFCAHCSRDRIMHSEATLVCPGCGHAVNYIDTGITSIPFNASVDYTSFSYNTLTILTSGSRGSGQGEDGDLKGRVDEIRREIKINRLTSVSRRPSADPEAEAQQVLRARPRHHQHPQRRRPHHDRDAGEHLRNCFRMIQHPFAEHCPPTRKNFRATPTCCTSSVSQRLRQVHAVLPPAPVAREALRAGQDLEVHLQGAQVAVHRLHLR